MESEIGLQDQAAGLGDDLAVPVRVEPIDHHPVESGQPLDQGGGGLCLGLQLGLRAYPVEGGQRGGQVLRPWRVVARQGLHLQHRETARPVDKAGEARAFVRHPPEESGRDGGQGTVAIQCLAHGLLQLRPQGLPQVPLQEIRFFEPQERPTGRGRLDDLQARAGQRQEDAIGLNRAGNMDRLPIAVAQIGRGRNGGQGHLHGDSPALGTARGGAGGVG